MSSPRLNIFRDFASINDRQKAVRIQIQGKISLLIVRPDKEPIIKEVKLMDISVSSSFRVLIPALKKLEMVIPARTIVVRELSVR